jgi:DNA-binding LacI/PurR family transcriptional regulator
VSKQTKITINTIAEEAGVSAATVSRVLTGNARVLPEKREKIESVISKYNYKPNYANGVLAKASKKTLGIILPDVTHPYFGEVFLGAETMALEKGYGILLGNTMNDRPATDHMMESMLFDLMMERHVNGILLLGGSVDDSHISKEKIERFRKIGKKIPLVTPGIENPPWGGSTIVTVNVETIKRAVRYLYSLKHTRFGFLGGEPEVIPTEPRRQALKDVIEELDLAIHKEWFIYSGFNMEDGVYAMEKLLQNREIPTAIMCVNDLVAVGAIHTAQKHGLRVPSDISMIGCDNIPLSSYLSPALTTIDLKAREEGMKAIELLINNIEKKGAIEHIRLESEFVIRDSCRRAPE